MKKKPGVNQQDLDTFRDAVKGTKRIDHDKITLTSPIKLATSTRKFKTQINALALNETSEMPAVNGETHLSYNQSGISHKILRNLRKGQYNVEAVLDLHGMTVNEAKIAVTKLLQQSVNDGIRVVLIIHGKGRGAQPILKNKLNQWLRGITEVLAFCTASATHGSRGAMYVLLKRTQQEEF